MKHTTAVSFALQHLDGARRACRGVKEAWKLAYSYSRECLKNDVMGQHNGLNK